jgi:hypothetical protein
MSKIIIALLFVICFATSAFSQNKVELSDFELSPQFRSVQLDGSFGIWSKKIGGVIDYDIFCNSNKKNSWLSVGFRSGVDVIWLSEISGDYSPITHINAYARSSIEGAILHIDAYGGTAYQFISKESTKAKNQMVLKGGLDLKVKLSPYTGVLLNIGLSTGESYFGSGIYLSSKYLSAFEGGLYGENTLQ